MQAEFEDKKKKVKQEQQEESNLTLLLIWVDGVTQRQKNPECEYALHTGKFLRVRKVFARINEKTF